MMPLAVKRTFLLSLARVVCWATAVLSIPGFKWLTQPDVNGPDGCILYSVFCILYFVFFHVYGKTNNMALPWKTPGQAHDIATTYTPYTSSVSSFLQSSLSILFGIP